MRLAIVSHCFPPYYARSGGVATYSYNLARSLSEAGVQVTVFCGAPISSVVRNRNLTIFRLPYTLSEVPPNFVWFQLQNKRFLTKHLQEFDLIHSQSPEGTISLLAKCKSRKTKWVITFHFIQQREMQSVFSEPLYRLSPRDALTNLLGMPIYNFLFRTEIKYADHYFFVARTNLDDYSAFYGVDLSRCTHIPNGVDMSEIARIQQVAKDDNQKDDNSQNILFYGRLYARKGAEYLVRAMSLVVKEEKDAKLTIVGSGPSEPRLRSLINKLGLSKNISMEGFLSRRGILSRLYNCDLVVLPSLYEVQCTSVLEAMACRKCVLAFKLPSMEELISHMRTGYLVPNLDSAELAEGILLLLGNDNLRGEIGHAAFNYVEKEHDWKNLAKKYIETYESLI